MATSGSGTMTPVPGGGPGAGGIAEPFPYTLLSLPRFAKIMGINPVHFQGGVGTAVFPNRRNACSDIWPHYSYQWSDAVSRYEIVHAILQAENDIANFLGYWPAPKWVASEMHRLTSFHRPELTTYGSHQFAHGGLHKGLFTNRKKVISGGQRAVTLIKNASVAGGDMVFTDVSGDGFVDTVTITVATTLTDAREIKLYHTGKSGDIRWEIRPARSKTISGGNVVIVADAWLFIDPDIQAAFPTTDDFSAVNLDTTDNYVTSVDVYREYNDATALSAQVFWEPDGGIVCANCSVTISGSILVSNTTTSSSTCAICGFTGQDACLLVRDIDAGIVTAAPATYDSTLGFYTYSVPTIARDPDIVKLWYYAGDLRQEYLTSIDNDPLDDFFAIIIAHLAVARIERVFCSCANVTALAEWLRTDMAHTGEDGFFVTPAVLNNPFGTRRGEVMAWQKIMKQGIRIPDAFVI